MNAAAQRRLTPLLGGVAVLFGVLLLTLLAGVGRGVTWGPQRAATPLPPAHDQGLPPPVPLAQFSAVWTQPLFSNDRKPTMHTAAGGASLGDMQLTGIILTPPLHMALLRDKSGEHEVRVRQGDALPDGSWRLVDLKPRSAVFESNTGRTELQLPAGAPIDMPKGEGNAPPANPPAPNGMAVGPVPAAPQNGPMVNAANPMNPPNPALQSPNGVDSQADRIRLLKEAIQKRRAQQQAATPEGAH